MTLYRAQAVLKHTSGLPRDNVSNTFWFSDGGDPTTEAAAEQVAELVRDFYTTVPTGQSGNMANMFSSAIGNTGHEVKVAPITVATGVDARGLGFGPYWTESFDFVGRTPDTGACPAEVALCLSYKSSESGTVPPARRRGRTYFGPVGAAGLAVSSNITRPSSTLMGRLLAAGEDLLANAATAGFEWCIYSRPYEGRGVVSRPGHSRGDLPAIAARTGALYAIDALWVDNAFDTQRRRGERATARVLS